MKNKNDNAAAKFIAAIGEPTRIAIIRQLAGGTKTVGEIAKAVGTEIVNISHHLGVMRQVGLATDEKDGRFVRYTLTNFNVVPAGPNSGHVVLTHASGAKVTIPYAA